MRNPGKVAASYVATSSDSKFADTRIDWQLGETQGANSLLLNLHSREDTCAGTHAYSENFNINIHTPLQ